MKTTRLVKTTIVLILIMTVMAIMEPTVHAEIRTTKNMLKVKPSSELVNIGNPNILKIEIDVEELRQIKIAKKKALEEQKRIEEEQRKIEEEKRRAEEARRIVYDGMNIEQLSDKLNRSLHSDLSGKGELFARLSVEYNVDPYLAVAISMHETGCKWNCSRLVKSCNNVGGMKGRPGCGGGAYASFPSLDEGIRAFISNISRNYASKGLTTPEAMGPKYAGSPTWATQVRSYMNEIKAK
ncbi:MAG: glucosaminidase domain-containing protein [Bacilli bacterium]|nr:glucosaminidase domain-containing protein [Bacilli bacterium]